jgi:hypothetical protein
MTLWEKFQSLERDTGSGSVMPALPMPGAGTHYLAKGCAGEPVLLLRVQRRRVPRIPLGLCHVQVEFEVKCAVIDGDAADCSVAATFCRVVCDPVAPWLHMLFIHALAGVVERLPPNLTPGDVDGFFAGVMELFRSFSTPAKTSVLGLWGELLIISTSPYPNTLVTGWHVAPEQNYDFAFPDAYLEVKTTARNNRQHEFALTQLRGNLLTTFVASIVVEQNDGGENVFDLASAVEGHLLPHNRAKLWRLVAQSVGSEAEGAGDMRLLRASAVNSLRFYDAATLPTPEISLLAVACISAVRFSLDLDHAPTVHMLELDEVWRRVQQPATERNGLRY